MDDNNSAVKVGLISLVIIACVVLAFGLLFKQADHSQQKTTTQLMTRQQQMTHEALEIARQVQALNRERMEMMRLEAEGRGEEYASGAMIDSAP